MSKKPDEVSGMFSEVAPAYDRTNSVLSVGNDAFWRVATLRAVDPRPGERILDVAAGTGASSAAYAKHGASVVAVDFSPGMIEEGRKRHPKVEFVEADAEKLPFGDDEFDVATISFGLRNVNNPQQALAEMYRVLKPGGRVVICEFSKPPAAIIRAGYNVYLKRVMPVIARMASSNPAAYSYLMESIREWPDQGTLSQWIRGVGFTRVAYRNLTAGVVALHRGRKPKDAAVRASVAKRRATRQRGAASTPAGTAAEVES